MIYDHAGFFFVPSARFPSIRRKKEGKRLRKPEREFWKKAGRAVD
jgi:hypothetical protein